MIGWPASLERGSRAVSEGVVAIAAFWHRLHAWPRLARWSVKGGVLVLCALLALYPKVWLMPTWIERLEDLNSVLDPNYAGLAELQERVEAQVSEPRALEAMLGPVERVVNQRIPYAFDWDTWGVMDYVPTVAEVFAMGREDCDGRAVVAASLLRRMGYDAWLVCDLKHVWVAARDTSGTVPVECELMGPGEGAKTLAAGAAGTRLDLRAVFGNLVRSVSYGTAVFPLGREMVILVGLMVTAMQPRSSLKRRAAGCAILATALFLLRAAGSDGIGGSMWGLFGLAAAALAGGLVLLAVRAGGRRLPATRPQ
jgi:hypothetical protein